VTALDAADLVVIAGRILGVGTDAALAQMDIAAAQDALAEARPPGQEPGVEFPDRAAAAAAGVRLMRALLRHRPFPRHGQQVAVAAGLQFLILNGWRADLNPAAAAAVVVEALASGRLSPDAAAAWLSPRLSPVRRARRAPVAGPGPALRLPLSLPAVRVPVGRAVAGAVLAVAVTGVTLLAAACSRGPDVPAAPSGGVSAVRSSPGSGAARSADLAYAACLRSHGVESFPYPSAAGVAVIVPAAGIDLNSLQFRSAEGACRPAAAVHIVEAGTAEWFDDAGQ
jgi:prophage maintenance system killer protein